MNLDREALLYCLLHMREAYKPLAAKASRELRMERKEVIQSAVGEQGYVAQCDKKLLVIALRGSDQVLDWAQNLKAVMTGWTLYGQKVRVHAGFLECWRSIQEKVNDAVLRLKGSRTVLVVGHSHGGAVAQLVAASLSQSFRVMCLTAGAPRVGDADFVRYYDGLNDDRTMHLINDQDPIAQVPQRDFRLFGGTYHRTGRLILLRPGAVDAYRPEKLSGVKKLAHDIIRRVGEAWQGVDLTQVVRLAERDHPIGAYIESVSRQVKPASVSAPAGPGIA